MHAVLLAFSPHYPAVLSSVPPILLKVLVPRFVARYEQRAASQPMPSHTMSPEVVAEITINRFLCLLAEEDGTVPFHKWVTDLSVHLPDLECANSDIWGFLETLVECSGLIDPTTEGSACTLHPEWAERFTEHFANVHAKHIAGW